MNHVASPYRQNRRCQLREERPVEVDLISGTRVSAKHGVPCMISLSMLTTPASAFLCSAVIAHNGTGSNNSGQAKTGISACPIECPEAIAGRRST